MFRIVTSIALLSATIALAGIGTIAGHVYDKETGDPVLGAVVVAPHSDNGTSIQSHDGYFQLDGLPAGPETLRVTALGYELRLVPVVVVAYSTIAVDIRIRVAILWTEPQCYTPAWPDRTTRGRSTLRGSVSDKLTGRPVAGAHIGSDFHGIDDTGKGWTCTGIGSQADSNGNFVVFDIPSRVLTWFVYADGYHADFMNTTSLPDTTIVRDFHLWPRDSLSEIPSVALTGRVWNEQSRQPFPGVSVTLLEENRTGTTDNNGVFVLESLASGVHRLKISALGFEAHWGEIALGDKPVHRMREIVLRRE